MPRLTTFKLTNDFDAEANAHEETNGKNRTSQERGAFLKMGVFLILRHPSLDLLIWLGDSGVIHTIRIWLSIELKSKDSRTRLNDQILNSRAIRRYSWIELHENPLEAFFVPTDAETSEGPEPDLFVEEDCNLIDRFGYMTPEAQRKLGNKGAAFSLPQMIHMAKKNMIQSVRELRDEEAWKGRDTMDLQRMADLTIERCGNNRSSGHGSLGSGRGFRGGSCGRGGFHTAQSPNLALNSRKLVIRQSERGGLFGRGSAATVGKGVAFGGIVQDIGDADEKEWPALGSGPPRRRCC